MYAYLNISTCALQWYISTITITKAIFLIINLNSDNMKLKLLMKLTSLLLVETLSHSDHIMVYVSNTFCIDNVVPANSSQRQLIETCIVTKFHVTSLNITVSAAYERFKRLL